jgi:hypothetical protein
MEKAVAALRELAAAIKGVEEVFLMLDVIGGVEGLEAALRAKTAKADAERERAEAKTAEATAALDAIVKRYHAAVVEIRKDRRVAKQVLGEE